MSSSGSQSVPWLLGATGAPLIPSSWVRDGNWASQVIATDDRGLVVASLMTSTAMAQGLPAAGRHGRAVDWDTTGPLITDALWSLTRYSGHLI
jgi:hypothetical protein